MKQEKYEIKLSIRDLPYNYYKKIMKLPQSQKNLKFPPKYYSPHFEIYLAQKTFLYDIKLHMGIKNKSLLNTTQKHLVFI